MYNINIKFAELSQVRVYISNSIPPHEDSISVLTSMDIALKSCRISASSLKTSALIPPPLEIFISQKYGREITSLSTYTFWTQAIQQYFIILYKSLKQKL